MADCDGASENAVDHPTAAAELYEALRAAPHAFDFFQALRRIDAANPDRPLLGVATRAQGEPVRLGQLPSLAFAPATLAEFHAPDGERPGRLFTYFLGLFGPSGPLPIHLTEYARERMRNEDDPTIARFADLFHHRMLALFYRAWATARPTVGYDRPGADRFADFVGSLFGLGLPALAGRDEMPDLTKRHFSGRFALQTRPPEGLRAILSDFLKLPVEIEEFVPDWVTLPRAQLTELGRSPSTGTLGATATTGEQISVYHHKFRIRIGPMELADYERLLPIGRSLKRLAPIVRNYIGEELDWDVNLTLLKPEVPPLKLGLAGSLGWTSWLGTRYDMGDAIDLVLEPLIPTLERERAHLETSHAVDVMSEGVL